MNNSNSYEAVDLCNFKFRVKAREQINLFPVEKQSNGVNCCLFTLVRSFESLS